jgi:hypothetical protein
MRIETSPAARIMSVGTYEIWSGMVRRDEIGLKVLDRRTVTALPLKRLEAGRNTTSQISAASPADSEAACSISWRYSRVIRPRTAPSWQLLWIPDRFAQKLMKQGGARV